MPGARVVDIEWMRATLSPTRLDPYLSAAGGRLVEAFELHGWNARMSAALLIPAHFAEVVTRNAVVDVLESVYGHDWSTSPVFERSLPGSTRGYDPRADLVATRRRVHSNGQLVAELKFVFWQHMFAARHDVRLWRPNLVEAFPNVRTQDRAVLRGRITAAWVHDMEDASTVLAERPVGLSAGDRRTAGRR
jgi:hypothetical protein